MIDVKIIGIGGHSRSLASNFHGHKINIVGYYDDKGSEEEVLLQKINFLGFFDAIDWRSKIVIGIGDNIKRSFFYKKMKIAAPTLVHQTAVLNSSDINTGSQIFPNSFIGVNSLIGSNCIINTGAIIEHDTKISDNCHISVGAIICGNTKIGENCFIGAGAIIKDKIRICDNVVIGAGAVVVSDILKEGTYVGCPAKIIQ
jgi:UDP-N-acetylbacillosamine N-acetyltransferase